MSEIVTLLQALNTLTPVAVIALFGVIILLLVRGQRFSSKSTKDLKDNHLHEVVGALARIELKLDHISTCVTWIKAKVNGE